MKELLGWSIIIKFHHFRNFFIKIIPLLFTILISSHLPGCDVIKFEINLIFLIKPFDIWPKSQDKNLNILRTKRAFEVKEKAFFISFKGLSVAKNCLRSWEWAFKGYFTLLVDATRMYLGFNRPSSSLWLSSFIIWKLCNIYILL